MNDNTTNMGCGGSTIFTVLAILKIIGLLTMSWWWIFAALLLGPIAFVITIGITLMITFIVSLFN